jgi:pyruvate/2-oxoglutarate dehydrogenase complex dihydrolipoamide dehydrogenase (E3) component
MTPAAKPLESPIPVGVVPPEALTDPDERALFDAVRPRDWPDPEPKGRYHLVVLGGGTAGLVAASTAAGLGARVALIEQRALGGDCLHHGCVPSKALLRCARALADVRGAAEFGVRGAERASLDFDAVMARMRRLRTRLAANDSASRLRERGVDVFLGAGRFVAEDVLEVNGRALKFRRACIATGSRPSVPEVPGLEESGFLTNETVFSLRQLPRRLTVLGGGPLGCELAQAFARFGSEVTLVQHGASLLPREEKEVAPLVARALERDGVRILLQTEVKEVRRRESFRGVVVRRGEQSSELATDELLVAVGRTPRIDQLGLDEAGVDHDPRAGVVVDDHLRSTNRRIYAAGDVVSPFKFTHVADATARLAVINALFGARTRMSTLTIPWCTFTDPEVARVGLSERDAGERGLDVATEIVPLADVDRAILDGEEEGFLKLVIERGRDRILGATLVARHAGETISEVTALLAANGGMKALERTIHPYPTQAEVLRKAADRWLRRALTPRRKRLLSAWFALFR